MKKCRALWENERGDILPFALIAMLMGSLLLAPLLAHIGSSHRTIEAGRTALYNHYAADAGIEYALHAVASDSILWDTLIASPQTPMTLTMPVTTPPTPDMVNGRNTVIEIVYVGDQMGDVPIGSVTDLWDWVLWADSSSANHTIQTTGQGHTITGGVHSNHNISISGEGHVINGTVSYVDSFSGSGVTINPGPDPIQTSPQEMPLSWNLADFAPGSDPAPNEALVQGQTYTWAGWGAIAKEAKLAGKYYYHEGNWNYGGSGVSVDEGLHYCTENASLEGSALMGPGVTVVSEDTITLSGSNFDFAAYVDDVAPLVFFSAYNGDSKGINISGSGVIRGVSYAPTGLVTLTGSGGTIYGAFLGGVAKVAGSGASIELAEIEYEINTDTSTEVAAQVFDIRSTTGNTVITARVRYAIDGTMQVLSWMVE